MIKKKIKFLTIALLIILSGCTSLIVGNMADNISGAILNQDDPETVRLGAPAYLLMLDGMIDGDPQNSQMLLAAAKLYGAYASTFVDEPERAARMANKAFNYALRAVCEQNKAICENYKQPFDRFVPHIKQVKQDGLPYLYGLGSAWAGVIQTNSSDWNALADLPKVTAIMQQIVELNGDYEQGAAHTYLGVLASLRPPGLGGKPEQGRKHFERSIEISQGYNLMSKVLFARHYARLVYNRALHDTLLNEVLNAQTTRPGLTLINTLAKREAKELLRSADEYF